MTQILNTQTLGFNDDFYWSTYLQAVGFTNETNSENSFSLANDAGNYYYTILDSGSAHITLPKPMYGAVLKKLIEASGHPQYYTKEGVTFVDCYMVSTFANIDLMMNGVWLSVSPYDYVWDVYGDGETCILLVTEHSYDFVILGMPIY